jgi:hypothetical protein
MRDRLAMSLFEVFFEVIVPIEYVNAFRFRARPFLASMVLNSDMLFAITFLAECLRDPKLGAMRAETPIIDSHCMG